MKAARFALLSGLFVFALALAVTKVPLAELVKTPKTFDGKTIAVSGLVAEFKQKTSRKGNKYFTFKLKEGEKNWISVYSQGEAEAGVKDEAKVLVTGVFRQEKKVMDFTVKNELDATKVEDKENGVKVLK